MHSAKPSATRATSAEGLFVIKAGSVRIFTEENGKEISMGVRREREVFADIAMLREYRHESSVRSSGKTELLFIPRRVIEPIVANNPAALAFVTSYVAISSAGGFVAKLFDLRGKIDKAELEASVRSVGVKRVAAGKEILHQDARDDRRLYVVRQGEVRIVRKEGANEYLLATLRAGEVFGEKACLMRQEQQATAIANVDTRLLVVPEKTVHLVLERNPKLREVLEDRIRFTERELQRQKKLEERRTLPVDARPALEAGVRRARDTPLRVGAAGRGDGLRRRLPCDDLQALRDPDDARQAARTCQRHDPGRDARQSRARRRSARLHHARRSMHLRRRCAVSTCRSSSTGRDTTTSWCTAFRTNQVWVADPAVGFRKMDVEEFERGWSGTCLLFTAAPERAQAAVGRSPWVRFVGYLKPYKKILAHLFLATFVIQVLGVIPPLIIQNILDGVIVHQNVGLLHLLIGGLIISNLFSQLMSTIRAYLANFMVRNMDFAMMSQFFRHTMSLPFSFFAKRKTGDIFARFQENQTIRAFLTESTVTTALNLLMVFIYFTIMFLYNVKMTLLLIGFVIPIMALTALATPKIKNYAREVFSASTEAKSFLMEALGGVETIKGMGIERPVRLKWEKKYAKALEVQYRAQAFNIAVSLRQPVAERCDHDRDSLGRREPGAHA